MPRIVLRVSVVAFLVGAVACGEPVATRPSQPVVSASKGPASSAALQAQINGLINALFSPKDQGGIFTQFARIKNQLASGKTAEAQASIVAFVQLLLVAQQGGGLQDPNGAQPPSTAEALLDLVNSVAQFGGLPPPLPGTNPFAGDGAIAVVGPAGGTVVSSTGFGGVGFPPGALPADVIVVVSRLPDPVTPGAGPLPTALTQYPLFYDFSTVPAVAQFAVPVTVGICQLEVGEPFGPPTQSVADRLQLAHPNPANPATVELLERTSAGFIHCDGITLGSVRGAADRSLAARALDAVGRLFRPSVAYAVHGGLGGKTTSFSPFGAVDPGLLTVGVCGAPMPGVLATYPTVDIALANAAPGGDIRICPQTINVSATYLVDKPVTIEGDDPQNPPQFVVNSGTGLPAFRVNPVLQGAVTLRSLSFTLTTFDVAIDLGLGQGVGNLGSWWQVLIENSRFALQFGRAIRVFQTSVPNPKVIIRNNQMSGGGFTIVTLTNSPTSTIEVLSNSFGPGQSGTGILLQNEKSVRVEGNTFTGGACGSECIRLLGVTSGLIKNNTFTIPGSFHPQKGIVVQGGGFTSVIGNSIVGTGGGGPPSNLSSYAFGAAGVSVGQASNFASATNVVVSGNTISNAAAGIQVLGGGATVTGADNVVSSVLASLRIDNTSATASSLTITSSDFTTYFTPTAFAGLSVPPNTLVATCNWWGNVSGPQNLDPFTPATAYVPWATAPIANGAGGSCNGVASAPTISVGAITVSGTTTPVNLANVSGTIDVQLSVQPHGNTVTRVALFLDGNEVVQSTSSSLLTLNTLLSCNGAHTLQGRVFTVGGPVGGTASALVAAGFANGGGVPCSGATTVWIQAGAGANYSCGLRTDGAAFCWGVNTQGYLGDGTQTTRLTPVPVVGGHTFVTLAIGNSSACGLTGSGSLYCWGSNGVGELGAGLPVGAGQFSASPVLVSGGLTFGSVSAGLVYFCAITTGGVTYCWGRNNTGQLGSGTIGVDSNIPVAVTNSATLGFQSVSTGFFTTCALTAASAPYCWGTAAFFGNGAVAGTTVTPTPAGNGMSFRRLAGGSSYFCGIAMDQTALCWGGLANVGQTGTGNAVNPTVPTPVAGGLQFLALDANNNNSVLEHTCGVSLSGQAYCWGSNDQSQLGATSTDTCTFQNPFNCSLTPIAVSGGIQFSAVALGLQHTCGLGVDRALYCWGHNAAGELGDNTTTNRSTPVRVASP